MEVITEGTNSPKLTLSATSPPLHPLHPHQPPLFPLFFPVVFASGCLSQLSFSPLPANVTPDHAAPPRLSLSLSFQKHITHLKSFSFSPSLPVTCALPSRPSSSLSLSRSLSVRPSVCLSIRPLRHITLRLCASGPGGWMRMEEDEEGGESGGFQTLSPTSAP